jgi:hypothetical protein
MNRLLVRLGVVVFFASVVLAIATGVSGLFWGAGVAFALWALAEWAF